MFDTIVSQNKPLGLVGSAGKSSSQEISIA